MWENKTVVEVKNLKKILLKTQEIHS